MNFWGNKYSLSYFMLFEKRNFYSGRWLFECNHGIIKGSNQHSADFIGPTTGMGDGFI